MSNLLDSLSSLSWWISVVVVGILINLASAYLKNPLDNYLSNVSAWWRSKSEARMASRERRVTALLGNPNKQMMVAFGELRNRIRSLNFWVMGTLLMVLGATLKLWLPLDTPEFSFAVRIFALFLLSFAAFTIFYAMRFFTRAVDSKEILFEAQRREEIGANESKASG